MFPACEPLFLSGRDDLTIGYQAGGGIVIESGKSEDIHGLKEGVDEWSDDRTLRHKQQAGDDDDESENRSNPPLLAATQKCPEFFDEGTHIDFLSLVLDFF
jgi:hypothetical protein